MKRVLDGFTLIEVVIAFAVASLIIAAVASGLVATLRAEAMAHRQATAEIALRTLQTELWLGTATNNLATNLPSGWVLESENVEQGEGTNRIVWTHWRLGPETRRSFSATLSAQQP
ncbi:MAG: type II secretion system protein [Kiritimatiellaeota bacterium]|nr:type II secretion system protein [Kiritimatiellota bacterium]